MIVILWVAIASKIGFGVLRVVFTDGLDPILEQSEINNDWISPMFWMSNTLVSEFLPVIALLLSFWYGLNHRNKVIRSRKYSNASYNKIDNSDMSPNMFDLNEDDEFYRENAFAAGSITKISF